jgi:hypothetical protein
MIKYAGSDWLMPRKKLSPFGVRVADLLGEWACGIYHISGAISKTDWSDDFYIAINYDGTLDTFDNGNLTRLVMLAHWMCIRVEINSLNFRYMKISFSDRKRVGDLYNRHPTIDEAVERFKKYMAESEISEAQ